MRIHRNRFNIYLAFALLITLTACLTPEEKKQAKEVALIRLHLEGSVSRPDKNSPAKINRANPVTVSVETDPFLDSGSLDKAAVIEVLGGFALQLRFDKHGTFVLDSMTTANRGRHIAIFAQWTEGRWLAAPIVSQRIADGVLTFTPDASREEAEDLARRLNNTAAKLKKRDRF